MYTHILIKYNYKISRYLSKKQSFTEEDENTAAISLNMYSKHTININN